MMFCIVGLFHIHSSYFSDLLMSDFLSARVTTFASDDVLENRVGLEAAVRGSKTRGPFVIQ